MDPSLEAYMLQKDEDSDEVQYSLLKVTLFLLKVICETTVPTFCSYFLTYFGKSNLVFGVTSTF